MMLAVLLETVATVCDLSIGINLCT